MEVKRIKIIHKDFEVFAELTDENPKTVELLLEKLPLEGSAKLWKEEVYFEIPLEYVPENPSSTTKKGDIAYWPPGKAFCIFFGESQPYSEVNILGTIREGVEKLSSVREGDTIRIEKL
ncbi:MAG: cyclophilin-like fold protein [Candidatus Hydrothermarchaeota archaeon]